MKIMLPMMTQADGAKTWLQMQSHRVTLEDHEGGDVLEWDYR